MRRLCYGIAAAQSSSDLEQQLQELKQQYDETTRTMEQRIAALEQQIATQRAAAATTTTTSKAGTLIEPPKPRVARRLSHICRPIWNWRREQFQHVHR